MGAPAPRQSPPARRPVAPGQHPGSKPGETGLSATAPLLLLPVRIETRFVPQTAQVPVLADIAAASRAGGGALLLRVYPDTISTSSFEPELTSSEVASGSTYWGEVWSAADTLPAWRVLAAAYGPQRAAWIVKTMTPSNVQDRPATGGTAAAPALPQPATRGSSWERAPVTEALPDYWVAVFEQGGANRMVQGSPITPGLTVGLTPHDGTFPDGLPVDAGMRWLVDFAEAERVGMGIHIPLDAAEASGGFDRILVFGVRDQAQDTPGEQALAALLDHHHYTDSLALVAQGAPTNNTSDAASAFSSRDPDHAISHAVAVGDDLAADPTADGPVLAAALGLPAETFAHLRFADMHGLRNARDMLTALWPATFGYFVSQMMDPVFSSDQEDAMRRFALDTVAPRGPLPAVRVGLTPYGVLPTTSLGALGEGRGVRPRDAAERARSVLAQLVRLLLPVWKASAPGAPHVGASGDPDQDLLGVLGMDASSMAVRGRRVIGDDALWNMLVLLDPSGPPSQEWWDEHLARGRALLGSLGLSTWDPRVIHTAMGRDSYPVPYPTVEALPLSETRPLAADATLDGAPVNYIQWLAHAPMADVWAETYPGPTPTAILYRVLRQSMLREYVVQAGRAQVASGVLAPAALREVELVDLEPATPSLTARDIVDGPVSRGSSLTWARYLDTVQHPAAESPLARLGDLRASMDRLAGLPTAELDRLLTETLDAASHRLDVWVTALSTSLLAAQRGAAAPGGAAPGQAGPALHLGAYGWVENVRPAAERAAVSDADAEAVARLDRSRAREVGRRPLPPARLPHEDSGGFVQAPSLTQAAAAAVLRSGFLSHHGTADEAALAIDLSSTRTAAALWLLDGVRQGLSLGALTGFSFEEQLHEQSLDRFVQPFRDAYPLVGDELHGATANGAVLPPPQVVDGVKLRAAWQAGALNPGAVWGPDLPSAAPDQAAVITMLERLDDMLDALGDLSIAESVFQIMRGNYGRAGGVLDAVSRGDHPPDPEIVVTPRPGLDVTHRLMLLFAGPPPTPPSWSSVTLRPRAVAEPWLSSWVASRLPDPATVRALVGWTVDPGTGPQPASATVSLRDLDVGPLDVLELAAAADQPQRADLEQRILLAAGVPAAAADVSITYDASSLPPGSVTVPDLLTAARALRDVIGAGRPLDLAAFALPDKAPTSGSVDLAELGTRVTALVAALDGDITGLGSALGALQADPASAAAASAVIYALLKAAGYGVSGAVPAPSAAGATLVARARRVLEELQHRRAAVTTPATTLAALQANVAAVLGASAVVLPHLTPPDAASVQAAFAQSAAMQAVDPQAVRRWLLQLSHVRPGARRLDLAVATTRLLGAAAARVDLAQLPLVAGDRWLGLPLNGTAPGAGRVAIEAFATGDPAGATPLAGLLVDEWLDRIPGDTTTSGVAFHYNEPMARAPQAMLLAVCPDARPTWDLDLVRAILDETLDLAKVRAVDLVSIQEVGQILPALYFPFNLQGATPATHFMEVAAGVQHAIDIKR
jgi:hypothetical protein